MPAKINFRDAMTHFNGPSVYAHPNEDLLAIRNLVVEHLKHKGHANMGGSIASGGEVPFTIMLPHCHKLKLVDHCYGSLQWACVKFLLLREHDGAALHKFFEDATPVGVQRFQAFQLEALKELPETLQNKINGIPKVVPSCEVINWLTMCKYWRDTPVAMLDQARERIDEVEFIHGDIRDLGKDCIDLLYISNAIGHTPHDNNRDALKAGIFDVMTLGGTLISTDRLPEDCQQITSASAGSWHCKLGTKTFSRCRATERFRYIAKQKDLKDIYTMAKTPGYSQPLHYPTQWKLPLVRNNRFQLYGL